MSSGIAGTSTGTAAPGHYEKHPATGGAAYPGAASGGYHHGHGWRRHHDVQPGFASYDRAIANPAPLGLLALGTTTLIIGLLAVQTRHITITSLVLAQALSVGGLVMLLAGMWEFATGNTFAATFFTIYAGFFGAVGIVYWPGSGIVAAYPADQFGDAAGVFFTAWFILTFVLLIGSLRTSISIISLLGSLWITFLLAMVGAYIDSTRTIKAAGAFAILSSAIAYVSAAGGLWTKDHAYFTLPLGQRGPLGCVGGASANEFGAGYAGHVGANQAGYGTTHAAYGAQQPAVAMPAPNVNAVV